MNIILLGYNGSIGTEILQKLIKNTFFSLVCVGREINYKPYINSKIKYVHWDFSDFSNSKLYFLSQADIIINCVGKILNNNNNHDVKKINFFFVKSLIKYISKSKKTIRLLHLSSVSVYGANSNYLFKNVIINESFQDKPSDLYSKTKAKADSLIIKMSKKYNTCFTYTILRITNVVTSKKDSNLFSLVRFFIKYGIWFKYSFKTKYNFVHAKDVASAVLLTLLNLNISKNKIYLVSDDENQYEIHSHYSKVFKRSLLIIFIPPIIVKFICLYFPLPKKLVNFFFMISSEITYSNNKIKKSLGFRPAHSLKKKLF